MCRILPVSVLLALMLTLVASVAVVSAQEETTIADVEAKFEGWTQVDAIRAGYAADAECVAVPGLGGTGRHYVNEALFGAPVDALNPPVILVDTGGRVTAVEYFAPADAGASLFGNDFNVFPPDPTLSALRMWFLSNPSGQFADFNPDVTCPEVAAVAEDAGDMAWSVTFRDADALSDSLVIDLEGVSQPATGTQYEGWLIAAGGASKVSTGILAASADGEISSTYTDPDGANLLDTYNTFAISSEPGPDPEPETPGAILWSDHVEAGAFVHVGHLLVAWPPNPDEKGIAVGLREQTLKALLHANLAASSANFSDKQLHLHHVVNIIEGAEGDNYDASFGDPGDGNGVLNYAADTILHATLAAAGAPDNETVVTHTDGVIASATNVSTLATRARDNALTGIAQTTDNVLLNLALDNAVSNLTRAMEGTDDDGDGVAGSTAAEGGANKAYTEAQDIAMFVPQMGDAGLPEPDTPRAGDALVGNVAMGVLIAGLALVAAGTLVLVRRKRETA